MGEDDGIHPRERAVKRGRTVNKKDGTIRHDTVGSMFIPQLRDRIETGHVLIDLHAFYVVEGRILVGRQEFIIRCPAEWAEIRMVSHHVIPAGLAYVLFVPLVIHSLPHGACEEYEIK